MPTSTLPRLVAAVAAGVTAGLALTGTPSRAQPSDDPIARQIAAAEEQLEVVIEDYNDLREELRANLRRADELGVEMAELERAMDRHRQELGAMMATAYRTSNTQSLVTVAALLEVASTDGLVDSLLLLSRLSREQQKVIGQLTDSRDRLAAARQSARQLADQQRGHQRQLGNRKQQIEAELSRLIRLRDATGDRDDAPTVAPGDLPKPPPGAAGTAVRFAVAQLGKPYQWGGSGPGGYDCSGLTSAAWAAAGVQLPHNAARQWSVVNKISRADRRPGDLVFYYADIHHVAIYVGADRIVHAPRPGKRIRMDRFDYQPIHSLGRPG
ncbi:NlpC/P60 family protein [Solwaraspora sp. WMMD1047]|uniref:C40 family peptidase n=1 Tax=Solwaraspora sp. WMMD1047 TaxID=3016102 RepID=UPI00241790ED|nr:C40 family peptidase [Solwaraspora sp. WMMD1047]MDG4828345.1 NlpC/P60 family protein [Solwaraspora sp. WMMD1047]